MTCSFFHNVTSRIIRHLSDFVRMFASVRIALPFIFVFLVLLLSFGKASGAIVITPITQTQYNEAKADSATAFPSWIATFQAGATSAPDTEIRSEIIVKTSTLTTLGQYTWQNSRDDINDNVYVSYDISGNLNASAGTSSVFSVQPTVGFNTILVSLKDTATAVGGSDFINGIINSQNISNMSADEGFSYVRIDLNEDSPTFNLNGLFQGSMDSFNNDVFVQFEGVSIANVPEPSVLILALIGSVASLFVRKR